MKHDNIIKLFNDAGDFVLCDLWDREQWVANGFKHSVKPEAKPEPTPEKVVEVVVEKPAKAKGKK